MRKDLEKLVSMIAVIPGIDDISLTTNGLMLPAKAALLKQAGLSRVNISLDSLRPERFSMITRGGDVAKVLKELKPQKPLACPRSS